MKRQSPTTPVFTFFLALFFAVMLTIAGCSANTISGPEMVPAEKLIEQETLPAFVKVAPHNEENSGGGGLNGAGGDGGDARGTGGNHN